MTCLVSQTIKVSYRLATIQPTRKTTAPGIDSMMTR